MVKELKDRYGQTVGVFDNRDKHRVLMLTYGSPIVLSERTASQLSQCNFWFKDQDGTEYSFKVSDVVKHFPAKDGYITIDLLEYANREEV